MAAVVSAVPPTASDLDAGWDRKIEPGRRTILSIFPMEMHRILPHAGIAAYIHPAAKKDAVLTVRMNPARMSVQNPDPLAPSFTIHEHPVPTGERGYTLIHCVDTYQWVQNYERERQEPLPIDAAIVAQAMTREWVEGRRANAGSIGIRVLDSTSSFKQQLDGLWEQQTAYFQSLVTEADALAASTAPDDRKLIGELHRRAAEWIGVENRDWCKLLEERRLKRCVACDEKIAANALVCKTCSTFLPDFYQKHSIPCDSDTAVMEFLTRTGKAAANKAKTN